MRTRRKKNDPKNLVIGILSLIVLVETLLLIAPLKGKFLSKPSSAKPQVAETPPPAVVHPAKPEKLAAAKIPPAVEPVAAKPKGSAGKIAIILDDWGYQMSSCKDLQTINVPLAVAILPKLEHSHGIAQCAHDSNKIVMLHLPLEPHKYLEKYPDDYYIKTGMADKRVIRMLEEALRDIPFVEGVNNHTGSKATEDKHLMSIIFERLKEKQLFFVDSFVTSHSICKTLAREYDLQFARRDVFLDNEDSREYIEGQFSALAKAARTQGTAIAIGHDRPLTLKILHEQIDLLQKLGFEIVSIKDLLKTK